MKTYREFRPTGFDPAGLALPDRQDWLVAPVGTNRDADTLTRSNWAVVTEDLAAQEAEPGLDVDEHEFGHWACGWFRICLVRPGSKAAECAADWEAALADYPVASEEHLIELEWEEQRAAWESMSLKERVRLLSDLGRNIFAARRDEMPEDPNGALGERLLGL